MWCSYLLWFAGTGQLHRDSGQVGSVSEGQEGRAGSSGEHILLVLRRLIAPHLRTQEEEEEAEGRHQSHEAKSCMSEELTMSLNQTFKNQQFP